MNININEKYNISSFDEFNYIYQSLTRRKPSLNELSKIYADIQSQHFQVCNFLNRMIQNNLDFESIEFYLRLTDSTNQITKRAKTVMYLAELDKENTDLFFNKQPSKHIFVSLLSLSLRAIIKFFKGMVLCRIYGIK